MNDIDKVIEKNFAEHSRVVRSALDALGERISAAADLIIECYRSDGGVFLFGNGGSAADAQHIAGELVGRFLLERPPLRATALSTDTSVLTCLANDYSFEMVFARQLEANARRGDVAVGLSSSGNSPNVAVALKYARDHGLGAIAITGRAGGRCAESADVLIDIPTDVTARMQEVGMLVYHIICEQVERVMAGSDSGD